MWYKKMQFDEQLVDEPGRCPEKFFLLNSWISTNPFPIESSIETICSLGHSALPKKSFSLKHREIRSAVLATRIEGV